MCGGDRERRKGERRGRGKGGEGEEGGEGGKEGKGERRGRGEGRGGSREVTEPSGFISVNGTIGHLGASIQVS